MDLLPRLYDKVIAPPAVIVEFGKRLSWLVEEPAPDASAVNSLIARRLDPGEAEAIVLARAVPQSLLLIDEARGRKIAISFGLSIIGTAGLLTVAKEAGLLPAVKPILDILRDEHDFRLADRHYEAVLRQAGEV